MAPSSNLLGILLTVLAIALNLTLLADATDPDPLQDYCVARLETGVVMNGFACKNYSETFQENFVFSDFRTRTFKSGGPYKAGIVFGTVRQFPALNTQGLGIVRHDLARGGLIPPHSHPRSSEILYVLEGSLYVGFISDGGKLFPNSIAAGDVAIFPRGLLHFLQNNGPSNAVAIAVQNSQFAGFQIAAESLFGSGLSDDILLGSFFLDRPTLARLRSVFQG